VFFSVSRILLGSVADPDPPNPHVFGPSGSGSTVRGIAPAPAPDPDPSIIMQNLDSYYFVTLFDL
jgi:hypothetical protein